MIQKKKRLKNFLGGLAIGLITVLSSSPSQGVELAKDWDLTGFLRNNTGVFTGDQDFTQSNDRLATERNWLRLKLDGQIFPGLDLRLVGQGIYEPIYGIEQGSTVRSGEYNEADLREAYLTWKPDKDMIRIGRQIVTWGESIAFRVGDVINPQDTRWSLAFANLEDTRIPQWMIRSVHQFTPVSSSFEWIVNPLLTESKYRVDPLYTQSTSAGPAPDGSKYNPGWRFAPYPETRLNLPFSVTPTGFAPGVVLGPPFARSFAFYNPLPFIPGFPSGFFPKEVPVVRFVTPTDGASDLRYGARTSTTLAGYQFGAFYWHSQEYTPVIERGGVVGTTDLGKAINPLLAGLWVVPNRQYTLLYPEVNNIGLYGNKEMPLGVLRGELVYKPNRTYNTLDPNEPSALVKRDNLQYLLAWDIQTMFRPLSETGTIDINLEYMGSWVFGNTDFLNVPGYLTPIRRDDHTFLFNIGTGFDYDMYRAGLTVMYNLNDNGAIIPSVKYVPEWFNKACSFELKYIGIFGKDNFEGFGLFQQKSMVVLTSQFSF